MADIRTIAAITKEVAAAYPNWKATEDTIKVWTVYLADIPDDLLVAAIRKFISSSSHAFPPSIPEIRGTVTDIRAQVAGLPSAYEAWEDLIKAGRGIKKWADNDGYIHEEHYQFKHPLVKQIAEQLGWPQRFPGSMDNEVADRAHYTKAYDKARSETLEAETQLPDVTKYIASATQQIKMLTQSMRG